MNDSKFMDNFIIYNISVEYVFFIYRWFHISCIYIFKICIFGNILLTINIRNKENGERVDYRVVDPNNKTR